MGEGRVVVDPRIRHGKPIIKGTRVPIQIVLGGLAGGMTYEEVMEEYDLTQDDILAALEYAAAIKETQAPPERPQRRPPWLRVRAPTGDTYHWLKRLMRAKQLHTVCEEAHCPNMGECWSHRTATFLILGDTCTRNCRFCNVKTGRPAPLDPEEPEHVAQAVRAMDLKHAVITSVDRDDVPDGGASVFAAVIRRIRALRQAQDRPLQPGCTVEVLIPDFRGRVEPLKVVMDERPDILNHNVETVPRLFRTVQPQCRYEWSLAVLRNATVLWPEAVTKSGLMVGLGETVDEVLDVMRDLRELDVDILTVGQYLQPTKRHIPIARYYTPEEFEMFRERGYEMGFRWVESDPLVRSSYNAEAQAQALSPAEA